MHEWALRHVFVELRHYTGVGPGVAVGATFLLSALFHELIASVAFKTLRPWFFLGARVVAGAAIGTTSLST